MNNSYMLDTNIVSELARNPGGVIKNRIAEVGTDKISTSVITAAELHYGCFRKGSHVLRTRIEAILGSIEIHAMEPSVVIKYGEIRCRLDKAGTPIGPNNLLIAAHACTVGAILVTANTHEFDGVPGLTIQNWLIQA